MSDIETTPTPQPETQRYIAIPKYKGCFEEVGHYTKQLSTGKIATLKYTTGWRWGECIVEITEKERRDIIQSNEVCLSNYDLEFSESTDGCGADYELDNKDNYTKKEMREIVESMAPGEEEEEEEEEEASEAVEDEDEEELSMEEIEKELREQQIDRISNGQGPTISYDLWLSHLTSEQREVEKEKQIQFDEQQRKYAKTDLVRLCVNMDCDQYPPDWDFEGGDTEETYQEGQWKKCKKCDGYYNDDGLGDILFVQEDPNNQEAECDLCGKTEDIVQMKGTGQYLCGNACDESDEEEEEEEIEPTICTDDCSCDKHTKPTVVKKDEHGNYNVIIVPVIESATCSDHTAFSEWFNSNIRRFEYIEAAGEDVEEVMRIWCEANNHEWRDDGVYNMNIHVPAHAPAARSGVENDDESPDAFECDDCNVKGMNCFENLGMSKDEATAYMDLGQPDRCEKCFDIWKNTDDAKEYLQTIDDDDASTVSLGGCDTDFMEDEGEWGLDETYYYIYSGCVLVPEGENIEDYAQGDGSYANKKKDPVSVFNSVDA
jgi:hypothetical protein